MEAKIQTLENQVNELREMIVTLSVILSLSQGDKFKDIVAWNNDRQKQKQVKKKNKKYEKQTKQRDEGMDAAAAVAEGAV